MTPRDTTKPVCSLLLIRHEHTELAGTFCGRLDPALSTRGRAQLLHLAANLRRYPFVAVYSSDLRRARETADALAAARRLPVRPRSDLREIAFGDWEGLTWEHVLARDAGFAQRWLDEYPSLAAPGGEEFPRFLARVQGAWSEISDEVQHRCAAVVTHAGVIRTVLADVTLECTKPVDLSSCRYGSWWEIRRRDKRWVLHSCSSGLRALRAEPTAGHADVACTA